MTAPRGRVKILSNPNVQPGRSVDWNGGYLQLALFAGPAAERFKQHILCVGSEGGNPRPSTLIGDWQRCCKEENMAGAWDSVVYKLPSDVEGSGGCEQIDVRSIMKGKTLNTTT